MPANQSVPSGSAAAAPGRPLRADAQRNRARLLATARDLLAESPDSVPMDAIARQAGVGVGTLYRHFPTHEALVEALYAAELDEVVASGTALLAELEPAAALRAWMTRYAEFFKVKRGISDALGAGRPPSGIATPATRERITAVIATMLREGADAGSLRSDVEPEAVMMMVLGVFLATTASESPGKAAPLLDLVVDALRP